MNVQASQTLIIALVVVGAVVLRALGDISESLTASVLVGGIGWAGGHAAGASSAQQASLSNIAQRYFGSDK